MIDNKELKALLKIMRQNGVLLLKTPELELQLSQDSHLIKEQMQESTESNEVPTDDKWANFPDGVLTDEQLAYYSAGGDPNADPENDKSN